LRAGGGVNGLGGREAFEVPESIEGLDNFLGVAENGDEVGLETLAGFELAVEEEGGRSFSRPLPRSSKSIRRECER
jgi:hypothetical protein